MAQKAHHKKTDTRTRTVSSNEAKQHWGAMLRAASSGEAVIVESHGKPKAVVFSPEAFEEYQQAREQLQREEALEWLRGFEERQRERNKDLTPEQVGRVAIRAGREINAAAAKKQRERVERNRTQ